ncbi:MAG: TetR/AcrR family transcriptional regulator [Pirellulaceae bacterium]|nr:TetR/AcrR family transcriptional regulator [Pirellulaceae bacterium]
MTKEQYPLRERRRIASRTAFIESARDLFEEAGFGNTSMEQIAERAGLHVQTLYRHFPTKQSLSATIQIEKFKAAFDERDKDTLTFWHRWVEEQARTVVVPEYLHHLSETYSDPKLAGVASMVATEYLNMLANGLAQDFSMDRDSDCLPILIANMLWGANADAVQRWSKSNGEADLVEFAGSAAKEVAKVVDQLLGTHHEF